jgi:predicted adenylyl cyclase CyaB
MIEIEKKFRLREGEEARLIQGAEFVKEKTIRDVYFDAPGWPLSTKDWWLRERDGRMELKVRVGELGHHEHTVEQYEEIEEELLIAQKLGLPTDDPLRTVMNTQGYTPFATIVTHRRTYHRGEFTIDFDTTDDGYAMVEIEKMAEDEAGAGAAEKAIFAFAQSLGLDTGVYRGKVLEAIYRQHPDQYRAMQAAGAVWQDPQT